MSFRKRNVGISHTQGVAETQSASITPEKSALAPGVRPSPIDGRPTISTGVPSLDALLAGHAGLALGLLLLIEESGTTDYAGALLRYCAAEGVVQGHKVHVVGLGEGWGSDLPGVIGISEGADSATDESGKSGLGSQNGRMKIAWRYERLGEFGAAAGMSLAGRRALQSHGDPSVSSRDSAQTPTAFCHAFDLAKRLSYPPGSINFLPVTLLDRQSSPFANIIQSLSQQLSSSTRTIHRIIIPSLLSPAIYPPHASSPEHVLAFLHGLRALTRQHSTRLIATITLPLSLYPRATGVVRWMEILADGVLELSPFQHLMDAESQILASSGGATANEEQPQGMLKIHKLPVFHERGGGSGASSALGDDLAFTMSRRKFTIKPFSLPPMERDTEAQKGSLEAGEGKQTKLDIDF